jgi:hypothetical protein
MTQTNSITLAEFMASDGQFIGAQFDVTCDGALRKLSVDGEIMPAGLDPMIDHAVWADSGDHAHQFVAENYGPIMDALRKCVDEYLVYRAFMAG